MKQKLLTLLAVLLTGGILVACGPDETAIDDEAGVVGEPVDGAFADDDEFANETTADALEDDATVTPEAEETVELEIDEEVAETEDAAAADTEADLDLDTEETEAVAEADDTDVAGGGAAAPAAGEAIVVTFSQAGEGIAVENIEGAEDAESIAAMGEENSDLNLTMGERYEFVYDGEGDLVFYNSNDEELFSTAGTESAFAEDADVNAQMEDGLVAFTVTEELAAELNRYAAGPEEQGGAITVN